MVRPFRRIRLLGTVPISIAVHLVVILLLLIIPLLANMTTPLPAETAAAFVRAAPAPAPPEAPHPLAGARAIRPQADAAPTSAPPTIVPDTTVPDIGVPETPAGVTGMGAATPGAAVSAVTAPRSPEPPRHVGPIRAAELPVAPVKIVDVVPTYPEIARAAHLDGTVTLECVIDTAGRVTNIHVLSSVPLLDQAAIEAVRQWRYRPTEYYGRPVSVLMTVTVRFVMR